MALEMQKAGRDYYLSDEEIADNLMGFLNAGYGTTASAFATILKLLSLSLHVLQRLRKDCEKLRDSKKLGDPLTWNDIKGVEYLRNVIAEGMRVEPSVIGGFKQTKIDVVYGGYNIPKGWKVHYSVRQTSSKEEYFDNPKKFNPDRFSERHEPFSNIPFGQGNRICPGNEFAKIEMELFLYHLVLRYDWDLIENDEPIIISFNPQPKHGLPLRLKTIV
ncbi:cytochrome P450 716B1-like [Cryptomeria japonica]|uniref:cytochrome P450 716B1-like n=1 Tax=Cryptomeria japonica TaxID=3369 RepID=UPI0025ACE3E5|nr:cytochrome P450 716B1-like [Cryptomeria japonica]